VGFAGTDINKPEIALAVVLDGNAETEDGATGGTVAGPVAAKVIDAAADQSKLLQGSRTRARPCEGRPARLQALAEEQAEAEAAQGRAAQIRTLDRSERIRTYNWPENRISDHRIGFKANNLDSVLNGDMEDLFTALRTAERAARLEAE